MLAIFPTALTPVPGAPPQGAAASDGAPAADPFASLLAMFDGEGGAGDGSLFDDTTEGDDVPLLADPSMPAAAPVPAAPLILLPLELQQSAPAPTVAVEPGINSQGSAQDLPTSPAFVSPIAAQPISTAPASAAPAGQVSLSTALPPRLPTEPASFAPATPEAGETPASLAVAVEASPLPAGHSTTPAASLVAAAATSPNPIEQVARPVVVASATTPQPPAQTLTSSVSAPPEAGETPTVQSVVAPAESTAPPAVGTPAIPAPVVQSVVATTQPVNLKPVAPVTDVEDAPTDIGDEQAATGATKLKSATTAASSNPNAVAQSLSAADETALEPAPTETLPDRPVEALQTARSQAALDAAPSATPVRGSPETVAHLAAEIVRKLGGRVSRFDIELMPAGLGKVEVRLEIGAQGQLTAAMSFDTPQAAADVRARAADLQRALEQAGFTLSGAMSFDVAGERGQSQQDQQPAEPNAAHRGRAFQAALDAIDAPPPSPSPALRRWSAAGVDIRI